MKKVHDAIIGWPVWVYMMLVSFLLMMSVDSCKHKPVTDQTPFHIVVHASLETDTVPERADEDAADDPALWYNRHDPSNSLIFGTDKKGGIVVYHLDGHLMAYHPVGKPNNVDIRYDFQLADEKVDILGFSNRQDNTIEIYRIDTSGAIEKITDSLIRPSLPEEAYGFCLYHSTDNGYFAFVNDKTGNVEQWRLDGQTGKVNAERCKTFKLPTQVEGMVADDEMNCIYVAEEDSAIWKIDLDNEGYSRPYRIPESYIPGNPSLHRDLEGLAIYYSKKGGYLIASSQGNNRFAVFNRLGKNEYLGSFSVSDSTIDGTSNTDGIEVFNLPLNSTFPSGIFIAQDGSNRSQTGNIEPQNFKLVDWQEIVNASDNTLHIDTTFNPVAFPDK